MTPEQMRQWLQLEMEQSTGMTQRERELFVRCENLQAELAALQKRVDAALAILKYCDWHSMVKDSIKILTGGVKNDRKNRIRCYFIVNLNLYCS